MDDLRIGFQAKRAPSRSDPSQASVESRLSDQKQDSSNKKSHDRSNEKSVENDGVRIRGIRQHSSKGELSELWIMAQARYENGKVTATVPKLTDYDPENLSYLVDVALNGQ